MKKLNVLNYLIMELLNKRGTARLGSREARTQALLDAPFPLPCSSVCLSDSKVRVILRVNTLFSFSMLANGSQ